MKMQTVPAIIKSRVDGSEVKAEILICPTCKDNTPSDIVDAPSFYVYGIHGHIHLECVGCGDTFCDGSCEKL